MKNNILLPFALTGLVTALAGCGGGSSQINEDPNKGVTASTSGCTSSTSTDTCMMFAIDYPVDGLNFDCSSDTTNHFATEQNGNVFTGGCQVGDKVTFYIQGSKTSRKITLGTVDLSKLRPKKVTADPVYISLYDIAQSATGAAATTTDSSDTTFKVLMGYVKLLQAISVAQANQATALQTVELTADLKNNLSAVTSDVGIANFKDGSYATLLQPWVDLTTVSDDTAQAIAIQLINQSNVGVYSASHLGIDTANTSASGFYAQSQLGSYAIADMQVLTTRAGYSLGYSVEWTGTPKSDSTNGNVGDATSITSLTRQLLAFQVVPQQLNATTQQSLLNPLTSAITSPFIFASSTAGNNITLTQGKLFNGYVVPGNQYVYKGLTGATTATDPSNLGAWNQSIGGQTYNGTIDITKTNPVTYLDKKVFKTINTVASGQQYVFPLYATLTFHFTNPVSGATTIPDTKLSIVIDENGDIRTNMADANTLTSDQCPTIIDNSTYKDSNGVQQYRIGTTGTTNYTDSDKSLTVRMILANPVFGVLNGAVIGLQTTASYGVRMNLQNLLVNNTTASGINITSWDSNNNAATAAWSNTLAGYQQIYNSYASNSPTIDQLNLAQRQSGTILSYVSLPSCYSIKTKS